MATAVAIMDRPSFDSNTDVLVVADPAARSLVWIPRDLWLSPQRPIEEGKRRIVFKPPFEELSGERIHQWIGAR
jgi:hypothetical protein